jgi:hypothetical protein
MLAKLFLLRMSIELENQLLLFQKVSLPPFEYI